MSGWTPGALPSQDGRTVVVTGATSGIGLAAARSLARAGARVVLAVRDTDKGARVAATFDGRTDVRPLDVADLSSVRAFADGWDGDLDVLVANAGIMAVPRQRTVDGFELQLGTNHLGHFALTNLLLPHLRDRVVVVSSFMHQLGGLDVDDLNFERRRYRPWTAYAQSKLANLLFVLELQRRLDQLGSPVRAVAAHPGYAATHLQSGIGNRATAALMSVGRAVLAQSPEMGSWPTLLAATGDLPGAAFVGPALGVRGNPVPTGRSAQAQDGQLARRLWERSEELTGTRFPEAALRA